MSDNAACHVLTTLPTPAECRQLWGQFSYLAQLADEMEQACPQDTPAMQIARLHVVVAHLTPIVEQLAQWVLPAAGTDTPHPLP